jgi:hypothetical protein
MVRNGNKTKGKGEVEKIYLISRFGGHCRKWSEGRSMTYGRHAAAAVDIFGQMFVLGGFGPGGWLLMNLYLN